MVSLRVSLASCLLCLSAARAGLLLDGGWSEEASDPAAWEAAPGWVPAPDANAGLVQESDGILRFRVPSAGQAMKWRRVFAQEWIADRPILALRYRAWGVDVASDQYFLYLADGGEHEVHPVMLTEVNADGEWHTLAIDTRALATTGTVSGLALHVPAATADAWLDLDWIRFLDQTPDGAEVLRRQARTDVRDWSVSLGDGAWTAEPDWLGNPVDTPVTERLAESIRFTVPLAGRGMKWARQLDQGVPVDGLGFVVMRYRASGLVRANDYAVAILGDLSSGGMDYRHVLDLVDLQADGRWHRVVRPIHAAVAAIPVVNALAVQVQAQGQQGGVLEIAELSLVREARSEPLEMPGSPLEAAGPGFAVLDLPPAADGVPCAQALAEAGIAAWETADLREMAGIPFALPELEHPLAYSSLRERKVVAVPVERVCSQVYVLVLSLLRGLEDPVFGTGRCLSIREIDRFRARVEYTDGTSEECFPLAVESMDFVLSDGVQSLCLFTDPGRLVRRIVLEDDTERLALVVLAATARLGAPLVDEEACEGFPPPTFGVRVPVRPDEPPLVALQGGRLTLRTAQQEIVLGTMPWPHLLELTDRNRERRVFAGSEEPAWLYRVAREGEPVAPAAFELTEAVVRDETARFVYTTTGGLEFRLRIEPAAAAEVRFTAEVRHHETESVPLTLTGPTIGPLALGNDLRESAYYFPGHGTRLHDRDTSLQARYGGMFPVQVMAAYDPVTGGGVYLRTEDTEGGVRDHCLSKSSLHGVTLELHYPERPVPEGAVFRTTPSVLGIGTEDWHTGLDAYTAWLRTWYTPAAPRRQWFREVFNFRQRFLHWLDPLYDRETGVIDLERALREARTAFGGLEYLHLFDWGNCGPYGRIYGRVGDHSPYDYLEGGRDALRGAIAGVQDTGVRVGLYIEGYLLEERGLLGERARDWQLIRRDGGRVYWPKSSEMFMCPWVEDWQDVQSQTYGEKVGELQVDGMYVDQFGFAGPDKDCWSREHGHPWPGYATVGERLMSQRIRSRVDAAREGVVLYGEETPCDVNSQSMDGGFSYHMHWNRVWQPWAPLHSMRFAIPSFKTFEILVCDKPTAPWAEGVKWVFFNGEGIWLEGPADEWFDARTRAAIRKCHALLREHRDAFTTDTPRPLIPTLAPGVFANAFPTRGKVVYTLYNARHRTFSGEVLSLDHRWWTTYRDAWNGQELRPEKRRGQRVLSVELGPRDVGCVVAEW